MRLSLLGRTVLFFSLIPAARATVRITIVPPSGMGELAADADTRKMTASLLGPQVQMEQNPVLGFYSFTAAAWNSQLGQDDRAKLIRSLQDYWGKDRVSVESDATSAAPTGSYLDP